MDIKELGITREEILNLAAEKLIQESPADSDESLSDLARRIVESKVSQYIADNLRTKIDQTLTAEIERLLSTTITPVDIFGKATGSPTTIRSALAEKAKAFWDTKVDKDGNPAAYSGEPRYQMVMQKIVKTEFEAAIRQNATAIVDGFKAALKADATRLLSEHIEKLIPARR